MYYSYQLFDHVYHQVDTDLQEERSQREKKQPRYNGKELGTDPSKCPGEGFEWKGKGKPGSREGSWFNTKTEEQLRPDFDHPPPVKPHWNYRADDFCQGVRIHIDGTWEQKK